MELARRSTRLRSPALWAGGLYFAVAVALSWPLAMHPRSEIFGPPGDLTGAIGNLQLWVDHRVDPFLPGRIDAMNAPEGFQLRWALNIASFSAVSVKYALATMVGAIATFAILTIFGYTLSGLSLFLLARKCGTTASAAAIFGAAFAFYPFMLLHAQWPDFLNTWILVVVAWRMLRCIELPTVRNGAWAGVATVLAAAEAPYFTLFTGILFGSLLVAGLLISRRSGTLKQYAASAGLATSLFAVWGVALALLAHVGPEASAEIAAGTREVANSSARPYEYVIPSADNPLVGHWAKIFRLEHLHGTVPSLVETTVYVGISVLVLAIVGVFAGLRSRHQHVRTATVVFGLVATGGFLASLPPNVVLSGVHVPTISYVIHDYVNSSWRVYSRLVVDAMLGLCVLGSLGLSYLQTRLASKGTASVVMTAIVAIVLCVDLWSAPVHGVTRITVPKAYQVLRNLPPGTVAEYPLRKADLSYEYWDIFYAHYHRHKIFGGYSRSTPDETEKLRLGSLSGRHTAAGLATYGVRYVIVRPHAPLDPWTTPPGTPGAGFQPIVRTGDVDLYRVTAIGSVTTDYVSGFYGAEIWKGLPRRWMGSIGWLRLTNPNPETLTYRLSGVAFSAHEVRTIAVIVDGKRLASFGVATSDGSWSFSLRLPAGFSKVELRATPPAQLLGGTDPRMATVYLSGIRSTPISSVRLPRLHLPIASH